MRLFYISFIVVLMGCTPSLEADAVLILDPTGKQMLPSPDMLFSVYSDMPHGRVTITEIRDQSISQSSLIYKEKSPSFLFQVETEEREKETAFKKDFTNKFSLYTGSKAEMKQSYVYSVFVESLYKLSQSGADQKSILAFSDMCENSSFSFYRYRKNPLKIREDYQEIVNKLEGQDDRIKDADLSGVTISVVFHPDKKDDLIYREVRSFWSRYYRSKNAQIEFVTGLEHSSLITQGL